MRLRGAQAETAEVAIAFVQSAIARPVFVRIECGDGVRQIDVGDLLPPSYRPGGGYGFGPETISVRTQDTRSSAVMPRSLRSTESQPARTPRSASESQGCARHCRQRPSWLEVSIPSALTTSPRAQSPRASRSIVATISAPSAVGPKAAATPLAQISRVAGGHDRASDDDRNGEVAFAKRGEQGIEVVQVLPGVAGEADDVRALFGGRLRDVAREVEAAQVDHLHARVAKRPRHGHGAHLVLVEPEDRE